MAVFVQIWHVTESLPPCLGLVHSNVKPAMEAGRAVWTGYSSQGGKCRDWRVEMRPKERPEAKMLSGAGQRRSGEDVEGERPPPPCTHR